MIVRKILNKNSVYLLFKKAPEMVIYTLTYVSLTYFFILFNIIGLHDVSIKISLLQSIIAFVTIGLSGDFRSIYLSDKKYFLIICRARFFLFVTILILFFIAKYFYFANISNFPIDLFVGLIVRRLFDWFDEILIATKVSVSAKEKHFFPSHYFIVQAIFILALPFFYKFYAIYIYSYVVFWLLLSIYIMRNLYKRFFLDNFKAPFLRKDKDYSNRIFSNQLLYQVFSTLLINANNMTLRYLISVSFPLRTAAMIISSFSVGGFLFSIISNSFLPGIVSSLSINKLLRYTKENAILYCLLIFISYVVLRKFLTENASISWHIVTISFFGGALLLFSNYIRLYLIQIKRKITFFEDFIIHGSFFIIICYTYFTHRINYFTYAINILSFFSFFIFYISYKFSSLKLPPSNLLIILLSKLAFISLTIYCLTKL